jgi:hypothetical protein
VNLADFELIDLNGLINRQVQTDNENHGEMLLISVFSVLVALGLLRSRVLINAVARCGIILYCRRCQPQEPRPLQRRNLTLDTFFRKFFMPLGGAMFDENGVSWERGRPARLGLRRNPQIADCSAERTRRPHSRAASDR